MINNGIYIQICRSFISLDLSAFNKSQVKEMNIMFDTSFIFEKIDVSGFDTKLETDMTYMFESLNKVEIIDVSKFKALNLKK